MTVHRRSPRVDANFLPEKATIRPKCPECYGHHLKTEVTYPRKSHQTLTPHRPSAGDGYLSNFSSCVLCLRIGYG